MNYPDRLSWLVAVMLDPNAYRLPSIDLVYPNLLPSSLEGVTTSLTPLLLG